MGRYYSRYVLVIPSIPRQLLILQDFARGDYITRLQESHESDIYNNEGLIQLEHSKELMTGIKNPTHGRNEYG